MQIAFNHGLCLHNYSWQVCNGADTLLYNVKRTSSTVIVLRLFASILELQLCSIYNLRCAICHRPVIPNRMNIRRNCRKRGIGLAAIPRSAPPRVLPR